MLSRSHYTFLRDNEQYQDADCHCSEDINSYGNGEVEDDNYSMVPMMVLNLSMF